MATRYILSTSVTLLLVTANLFAAAPVEREIRVAVIGSHSPEVEKLAPLVEGLNGRQPKIALLEREKIKEVFREQQLNSS